MTPAACDDLCTTREPFTDETNRVCDAFSKVSLRVKVPEKGELHYGSSGPTSTRRMVLAELERLNGTIHETAMKLQLLRKGTVTFAVYESLGDDAEREGHERDAIEWDTVDRACAYYEKYTHDKHKALEMKRREVALELALEDMQRAREHLLSACMET